MVIDACKDHGLWFDANELSAILQWIRKGGEGRVAEKREEEQRHRERMSRLRIERPAGEGSPVMGSPVSPRTVESLPDLLSLLFDI